MVQILQRHSVGKIVPALLLFLLLLAAAGTTPAQNLFLLSFGKGKVQVRLYTDYFCGPCSKLEPRIEYILSDLVRRNVVTLTFVDVPLHKYSSLYAKYFLYILNENRDITRVLKARSVLFEASAASIQDEEKLAAFLQDKGIKFRIFSPELAFATLQNHLREDVIDSTPTCVIVNGNKKEVYKGFAEIPKALENLK